MTIKLRARCEARHYVEVENFRFSGYYMLDKLPQDNGWRWGINRLGNEYDNGAVIHVGLDADETQMLAEKMQEQASSGEWITPSASGYEPSEEQALQIAKVRHAMVCPHPLTPMIYDNEDYGEKDER